MPLALALPSFDRRCIVCIEKRLRSEGPGVKVQQHHRGTIDGYFYAALRSCFRGKAIRPPDQCVSGAPVCDASGCRLLPSAGSDLALAFALRFARSVSLHGFKTPGRCFSPRFTALTALTLLPLQLLLWRWSKRNNGFRFQHRVRELFPARFLRALFFFSSLQAGERCGAITSPSAPRAPFCILHLETNAARTVQRQR